MARKTTLITLLLTAALSSSSWGAGPAANDRIRLFEKYDFKSGQYAVVGITWGEQKHKIQHELGNFYTDDLMLIPSFRTSPRSGREPESRA